MHTTIDSKHTITHQHFNLTWCWLGLWNWSINQTPWHHVVSFYNQAYHPVLHMASLFQPCLSVMYSSTSTHFLGLKSRWWVMQNPTHFSLCLLLSNATHFYIQFQGTQRESNFLTFGVCEMPMHHSSQAGSHVRCLTSDCWYLRTRWIFLVSPWFSLSCYQGYNDTGCLKRGI